MLAFRFAVFDLDKVALRVGDAHENAEALRHAPGAKQCRAVLEHGRELIVPAALRFLDLFPVEREAQARQGDAFLPSALKVGSPQRQIEQAKASEASASPRPMVNARKCGFITGLS